MAKHFLLLNLIAAVSFCCVVIAFEPSPLQDFCVADPASPAKVNGLACKDPKSVEAEDFFFSGLHLAGNTSNTFGSKVTPVNVAQIPGLNTLGISLVRVDYAPWGINPPHTHPRATEILTVLEGSLQVGFVTSNPENRLITKVLKKGDVFVFPIGLVHYQRNVGYGNAVAVAALSSQNPAKVNGLACKDPKSVEAEDFFFSGLHLSGNTSNTFGSKVTPVNVAQIPGLNTLGISLVRVDYAPWGINPPHTHPRATEILTVLEGSLQVGFVTSNPENRLITKVLKKGDTFVFPIGLVHYQRNVGYGNAVAVAALSSQNPGVISIANAVFGSEPAIATNVLAKAFQVEDTVVAQTQSKF
ncbi:hypothetical protein HAX54_033661 [Datura stramonium]|uniref:Cupin type-1 domain-containing protein n=1 Tax=Datura stramonium TaxID=4076 RepID=A0ABS8VE89_DATST|nr:hypothetical protein [Datura stramonium]